MRTRKHESQVPIEYRSSTWRTEIKGNFSNPKIKGMVTSDFVLRWIIRFALASLTAYKILCHTLP